MTLAPPDLVPKELVGIASTLSVQPLPVLSAVALAATGSFFWVRRKKLEGRWDRWGLLGLILFLLLCVTGLNVFLSFVFRGIDNQLVERNEPAFYAALAAFGVALLVAVPIIGLYGYLRQTFGRRWRGYLS